MGMNDPDGDPRITSYVAVGDSFTEGLGDAAADGTLIGWADRLAGHLSRQRPQTAFSYANLAIRGTLIDEIIEGQVPRARALHPDLVTFCAGGNDLLRPGSDPDRIADRYDRAVAGLVQDAGTVVLFTGFDTRGIPVLRHLRGRIATYTAHVRAIADRHGCPVVDLWSLDAVRDRRAWTDDRLHLSSYGHTQVALRAADLLTPGKRAGAATARPMAPARSPATRRSDDLHWAREHFVPWVGRRLFGGSAADDARPKRPDLLPL
ncbi:SGNH/GDSL hydrolase family protein (plasmid) [Streptomyces sp. NBC_00464]|uniref:SGNH/GDSL hydrolase family protein n=1 Tax=Streptomyces sp. NBC_00464 TaxID=2975751 RepID=UPI002E1768FF